MKILFYSYNSFNVDITTKHITILGHSVEILSTPCTDYNSDMNLASQIINKVNSENFTALFSYNYYPIIAVACNVCNIPYYSWVYDSPHLTLFSKTIFYPTNRIYIFDKSLAVKLQRFGATNVFHLPLGIDSGDMLSKIESNKSNNNIFLSDVSFVGSMYTDKEKRNYYDSFKAIADFSQNSIADFWNNLDNIIHNQCFNRDEDLLSDNPTINYSYLRQLMIEEGAMLGDDYFADLKDIVITSILEKKTTICERQILMDFIAKHCSGKYSFKLFTGSDVSEFSALERVKNNPVNYQTEMPSVFINSKINLHISLRSIHSGIPLRALDILSCGGFLLCDAQDEILENFTDGVDLAIYHNPEECMKKIDYYLNHEKERKEIALNGQKKAMKLFNYDKMLSLLFYN